MEVRSIGFGAITAGAVRKGMILERECDKNRIIIAYTQKIRKNLSGIDKFLEVISENKLQKGSSDTCIRGYNNKDILEGFNLVGWLGKKAQKSLPKTTLLSEKHPA